jgi:uncharacterized protein YkwD
MLWGLVISLGLRFFSGDPASMLPSSNDSASASVSQPSPFIDTEAEQQLLDLANQARKQAGVPALESDPGLTTAARTHADLMAEERQLSHQFSAEPSLPHRLAAASSLLLDRAGENVAVDVSAAAAAAHLMLSAPHRENLLNPSYNVAGFGAIRDAGRLYVVEDFAHSVPRRSAGQAEEVIIGAVAHARRQANLPALAVVEEPNLRQATCSMAQRDRLGMQPLREVAQRSLISYTNAHPEVLPAHAQRLITERRIHNVSVAACYARTNTYPSGVYWVSLFFY